MTASLHKLTAGDGYTYLTSQVARSDATELGRQPLADYYSAKGESPGQWRGRGLTGLGRVQVGSHVSEAQMRALFGEGRHPDADVIQKETATAAVAAGATAKQAQRQSLDASALGARYAEYSTEPSDFVVLVTRAYQEHNQARGLPRDAPVPPEVRSTIRTRVGRETFKSMYHRAPLDERELSSHVARSSRPPRQAVAGYDVTFSPVKSVSTLWAVAALEVSQAIEAAHQAAVQDAMDWVEREVSYTRRGRAGVRQVDVNGLLMAQFVHRDSRAGDPDLHTHVAVSNKVQAIDGSWLALDGQPLHQALVSASERYNTRLEAELVDRLGVTFSDRNVPGRDKWRVVREIEGVSPELMTSWSSRRVAIDARRSELATVFMAAHGRAPTPKEAIQLAQQATLETREAKHEPRSLAEQRTAWQAQAQTVLGSGRAVSAMVDAARAAPDQAPQPLTERERADLVAQVVRTVESDRARWQIAHVRAETERVVRAKNVPLDVLDDTVKSIVADALGPERSIKLTRPESENTPAELLRRDGQSQYVRAGTQLYTSERVLAAEERLITAAKRHDGRALNDSEVGVALLESAANGTALNPAQAQLVTEMATSGARLQLGLAPAGSGKTTAMRALSRAWESSGGTVVGLAPSAVAAAELRDSIEARTDTLAKLTFHLTFGGAPDWIGQIDEHTLVVIDEAGMAATPDLDQAVEYVIGRGGSVRLIGDDQQLAAIGAGGILRDIASEVGAVTLSELHRFVDVAEGEATLALRDGQRSALGYYLDRDRVHVTADPDTLAADVLTGWRADVAAGKESLMLAHTNATVTALNSQARAHQVATGVVDDQSTITLDSGLRAGAGDPVVSRMNNRLLMLTSTHWVKNGDRWTIVKVRSDGGLNVRHDRTGRKFVLPADYCATSVDLGYATTYHGAQGSTVDTTHCAITGSESRQLLYVGMSRGREANSVYVPVAGDGDPHKVIRPEVISPRTAVDVLEQVLDRDDSPRSARTEVRALHDPRERLREHTRRYVDAVDLAAQVHLGPVRVAELTAAAETHHRGLSKAPAWDTLLGHLCRLEADGHDAVAAIRQCVASGQLSTALDPAAVLDWRLDPDHDRGTSHTLLPWLPAVPQGLTDPQWAAYLTALSHDIDIDYLDLLEQVVRAQPEDLPQWAHGLNHHRDLVGHLAAWRSSVGVQEEDTDPVGPVHPATAHRHHQDLLTQRVLNARGREDSSSQRWEAQLHALEPRLLTDPYWVVLADRLDLAAATGIDVPVLLHDAMAERPLPDEHPAAALWSRLTPTLSPAAALAATSGSGATRLRPPWCETLAASLGPALAATVMANPHWPGMVAAVHAASIDGHDPAGVVAASIALVDIAAIGTPNGVPAEGLATVLTWRIREVLTADTAIQEPPPPPEDHLDVEIEDFLTQWAKDDAEAGRPATRDLVQAPPEEDDQPPGDLNDAYPGAITRDRVIELTGMAAQFYQDHLPGSPALGYAQRRLGPDAPTEYGMGYAPAGWDTLCEHLRTTGATDTELVDAGLAKWSRRGTLIDVFRDRLVLPLREDTGDLVGFIGRAAPGQDTDPKYLNTPNTEAFSKGQILFGLPEHQDLLTAGARPVRVEGAFDAIAVTAAGGGRLIGVAPLGTALTDTQCNRLVAAAGDQPVLVAPDNDPAGLAAAEKDYWALTARGAATRAVLTDSDPAQAWENDPASFVSVLEGVDDAPGLASVVVDHRLDQFGRDLAHGWTGAWVPTRVAAARSAAEVIAAAPLPEWGDLVTEATARLGPESEDALWRHVMAAALSWDPLVDVEDHPDVSPTVVAGTRRELANLVADLDEHLPATTNRRAPALNDLAEALAEQDRRLADQRAEAGLASAPQDSQRDDRRLSSGGEVTRKGPRR